MNSESLSAARSPCLCNALRKASRAVSRLYDEELRPMGLRTTQFSLLANLNRSGEVRQGNLSDLMLLEETTVTRNVKPLLKSGWVAIRAGTDRREKLVSITDAGRQKFKEAVPAWIRAQRRMKSVLTDDLWNSLLAALPDVAEAAAVNH